MRKIWTIAQKELLSFFGDRNLVIIMIAAPLAIATIIGLAFGNMGGGDVPIKDIPVAIINQDSGNGQQNYGDIFVNAFIPNSAASAGATSQPTCPTDETASGTTQNATTLQDLTNAVKLDDPAAAKAGVDAGTYAAAIIIPADFSKKIGYSGPTDPVEPSDIEVYANSGQQIGGAIIRSIVESIGNQVATGNIAIASTFDAVGAKYGFVKVGQIAGSANFSTSIACAFTSTLNPLTIDQQTVAGQKSSSTVAILVLFGSAQAMFFSLFTGQQGVLSIIEERKQGTLQRLVVSPTPRLYILIGKLLGTFVTCFVQLAFLLIALTVIGSILSGQIVQIWGNNLFLVVLVLLAAALASTGLGTFLAGVAKTPEQSAVVAQIVNIGFAILGGAFGFQLSENLAKFSPIYWGTNAFLKLAANQWDVGLNILVLAIFGFGLFAVGFWMFNRRLDI
jgi:ABC-type transport system involved in multi-copper enzyme maturation permease subunit